MGLIMVPTWCRLSAFLCDFWLLYGSHLRPNLRIRMEDRGEKAVILEDRRRAVLIVSLLTHALDTGSPFR